MRRSRKQWQPRSISSTCAWSLATIAESAERLHGLPDADARCAVVHRIEAAAGEAREYIATLARAA